MNRMPKDESEETFRLIRSLGTGGFAQTWLAEVLDEDLVCEWKTNEVAVKIPLSKSKEAVLRKEVELNCSLYMRLTEVESHNICRYLGFGVYDGKVVMVMEYVAGGNLRKRIGRPGYWKPLAVEEAVDLMTGILSGLAIIHKNQIVHRDIKPENILIRDDIPQISDMGIGRLLRQNELASSTVGTIFYMAPEMLTEDKSSGGTSFYSDIWSVGITFYEMLYGIYPFGIQFNAPIGTIIEHILRRDNSLDFPETPVVPDRIKKVLAKSLDRNTTQRYQNASEMLEDLKVQTYVQNDDLEQRLAMWQSRVLTPEQVREIEDELPVMQQKFPKSGKLYQFIGEFYNKIGQYDKALVAFRKGIGLEDKPAMLYWGLAMAYEKKKDYKEAVRSLEQALFIGLEKSHARYAQVMLQSLKRNREG